MSFIEFVHYIRNDSFHRNISLKSYLLFSLISYFNIKLSALKDIFRSWYLLSNDFYFVFSFVLNAKQLSQSFYFFFEIIWLASLTDFQCFESSFNSLCVRLKLLFQWAIFYHAHIKVKKTLNQWNRVRSFDQFITLYENAKVIARFYLRSVLTKHLSTIDVLF